MIKLSAWKEPAMSCTITPRKADSVVIIDIVGRVSFQDPHLPDILAELILSGSRSFVINLNGITYIDSYGLRDLVTAYNAVKEAGGKMNLLRPIPNVRKVLDITMKGIFEIFEDEAQATTAVKSQSKSTNQ